MQCNAFLSVLSDVECTPPGFGPDNGVDCVDGWQGSEPGAISYISNGPRTIIGGEERSMGCVVLRLPIRPREHRTNVIYRHTDMSSLPCYPHTALLSTSMFFVVSFVSL